MGTTVDDMLLDSEIMILLLFLGASGSAAMQGGGGMNANERDRERMKERDTLILSTDGTPSPGVSRVSGCVLFFFGLQWAG